tara:strand:+ start:397 stop:1362 length:966 start_codon:yes stop_codon:yes gene_type:complete
MAKKLQLRGGTTAQHSSFTGALREVTVDTDKDILVVHDGATAGGFPAHRDLKGADVASASPTVIPAGSNYVDITGTTGFAAFTVAANTHFFAQFDGVLTMTHHATNLDLPGGANITTAAGDVAEFFSTGANTVQCVNYTKASGKPIVTDFVNADINASAAIAQSKLVDIVNADIGAAAAIDQSKIAGLNATPSPDHTINGPQTNTVLAGYTTAIGDLVYLDPNGRWEEADADATSTSISLLGIAMEVQSDGAAVNVALSGSFIVDASWSFGVGVPLYVHTTAGGITATKPTGSGDVVRTVGYALTATTIFFAPSSDYVTLA